MNNPVNLHINRYFTQDDKNEIIRLFCQERKDIHIIAEKLDTLPNHVTWALIRWGYLTVTRREKLIDFNS